jgi:hypothetical protein
LLFARSDSDSQSATPSVQSGELGLADQETDDGVLPLQQFAHEA